MSKKKLTATELAAKIKELQQQQQEILRVERAAIGEAIMAATGVQCLEDFRRDFKIERRALDVKREDDGNE